MNICNNCKHFKNTVDGYGHCDVYNSTFDWQCKGCGYFRQKRGSLGEEREDTLMAKDFLEEHFVKGAKSCYGPQEVLNWYRNLYYKEDENSERRIVAEAINEFFVYKLSKMLEEAKQDNKRTDRYEFMRMVYDIYEDCKTTEELNIRCIELRDIVNDLYKQNLQVRVRGIK